jgi:hypothetical protein
LEEIASNTMMSKSCLNKPITNFLQQDRVYSNNAMIHYLLQIFATV